MVDFKELLSKAFEISKDVIFKVKIYEPNSIIYTTKLMTYFELGSKLINNAKDIQYIELHFKL